MAQMATETEANDGRVGMAADSGAGDGGGGGGDDAATDAPGSEEAIARGCTCSEIDNRHGRGDHIGITFNHRPILWVQSGCPIHAPRAVID